MYNLTISISMLKDFHLAISNSYIFVDYNQDNHCKKVLHLVVEGK